MQSSILTLETNKYSIKIENFEGPLDLLCHLIDESQMDIYDVNINEITDQYIEYLKAMEELDLEITSEFLIMASNLLYIKSKKLLPSQEEQEEMLSEEELIQRIIDYKKYKEITHTFLDMYEKNQKRIFRNIKENIPIPEQKLEEQHEYMELVTLYKDILDRTETRKNKNSENLEKIAITETVSVADTVKDMFRALFKKRTFIFNKLFSLKKNRPEEVVTAFSGLLEMSRRNKVLTEQEKLFGDITVTKRPKDAKKVD